MTLQIQDSAPPSSFSRDYPLDLSIGAIYTFVGVSLRDNVYVSHNTKSQT